MDQHDVLTVAVDADKAVDPSLSGETTERPQAGSQGWDILSAANCGDIPANCTAPATVTHGDGNSYVT